ncbi:MAG: peroxiredoxin [Actinomycetota bacterium]|nr:peroxiredoxin [Actinomycetota bacterium]
MTVHRLPHDLPVPTDDGAADHVPESSAPGVRLASTDGGTIALDELGPCRTVLYLYPRTGRPEQHEPPGWDEIPGARGCTPEACGFRDHHEELRTAGASRVFGLSSQDTADQREAVDRLGLPFALLSDPELELAAAMKLPTFTTVDAERLYKRLTMVVSDGAVEHVFYPVFPPDEHADEVLAWLRAR